MSQPSNVYSVYDAAGTTGVGKGNREDLVNIVYDISPTDTPALTAIPRGTAKAVLHEWTTHALASAAANEKIEGDDATINAATAKTRLSNYTAISNKVAGVTKTQQAVDKVGMMDALAEEVGYKMAELKRDMETMLFLTTVKTAGSDSAARKTAGIPTWLSNSNRASDGADSSPLDGSDAPTDGTQRAFQESQLLDVSQQCYDAGGSPSILIVGTFNKRVASGFAGNQTRQVDAADRRLINSVSFYEDDFNTLKIVPDRFSRSRDAVLLDTEYVKVAYLRAFDTWDLAVTGSSMRKQIETEWAIEMSNPDAHGIIADLTTS
jgi:hypothetical protein